MTAEVAGVRITHPDRVMYPRIGATKLDLARYYETIAAWVVPHTQGRPLTLVRCPTGLDDGCFYMRHSNVWAPEALRRVRIQEKTKLGEYLVADSPEAVVSLVQMNVVEIHTWNSRMGDLERPDRLVFDIDPGPEVSWRQVVETARVVRETLNALGLRSFVKTTGGRGVHVVAPLTPSADWHACLAFTRGVAGTIARHDPVRFTTRFAKRGRERRILIDYLRNNRTNTSIAAYSMRARPGAPVSVPLDWNELTTRRGPERFTILTVPQRLASLRDDPWQEYWTTSQRVTRAMVRAVGEVEEVEKWRSGEVEK
jgi:bifunctional non-homologous end joining protein LigD